MATAPKADTVRPDPPPRSTTADQVAEMESEGQGQQPNPTAEAGRTPAPRSADPDAVAPPSASAAEDQAIDTTATGLVSSDEDEASAGRGV